MSSITLSLSLFFVFMKWLGRGGLLNVCRFELTFLTAHPFQNGTSKRGKVYKAVTSTE